VARSSGLVYAAAAAVQGPAGSSGRLSLCFRDDQASCCGCHRSGPVYGPIPAHHPRLFRRSRAWMGQTGRCIPRAVRAGPARPRAPPRKPGNPRGQVEDQPRRIPRHDTAETVGQRADAHFWPPSLVQAASRPVCARCPSGSVPHCRRRPGSAAASARAACSARRQHRSAWCHAAGAGTAAFGRYFTSRCMWPDASLDSRRTCCKQAVRKASR